MKRVAIKVRGRVQGVFFRDSARKKANKLGLTGWVRNEDDGSVLIIAEGETDKLRELIRWCESGGPILARVDRVDVKWKERRGEFNGFDLRY